MKNSDHIADEIVILGI